MDGAAVLCTCRENSIAHLFISWLQTSHTRWIFLHKIKKEREKTSRKERSEKRKASQKYLKQFLSATNIIREL